MSLLHQVKNRIIKELHDIPGNLHIVFDDDSKMTIYNHCRWSGGGATDIVGLEVTDVTEDSEKICFSFGDKVTLEVNARPDTDGPEVLTISYVHGPFVAVN